MFGNKGGGGGNGGGGDGFCILNFDFSLKFFGGGFGLIVGLIVVVWLVFGFYIVDVLQWGIVLQFGSYKELIELGLCWCFLYFF